MTEDDPAPADELAALEALRTAGDHEAVQRRAVALADANPDDVAVVVAAAYACDRVGRERLAVGYYDRAWQLGGPAGDERARFLLGYGSTLRNVGRHDDAVAVLAGEVPEALRAGREEVRGDVLLARGDRAGARAAYEKAKAALPKDASGGFLSMKLDYVAGQ